MIESDCRDRLTLLHYRKQNLMKNWRKDMQVGRTKNARGQFKHLEE